MLLELPTPPPITDIKIETVENGASTRTEAVVVAPAAQKTIEPLETVSERARKRIPSRLLFDPIPKVRLFVFGNLDPRHESKLRMPLQSNSLAEKLKALTQISYPCFLR